MPPRATSVVLARTRATTSTVSRALEGSSLRQLALYLVQNVIKAKCLVMVHLNAASVSRGRIRLTWVEPRVSSVLPENTQNTQVPLLVRTVSQVTFHQKVHLFVNLAIIPDNYSPLVQLALIIKPIPLHLASGGITRMTS